MNYKGISQANANILLKKIGPNSFGSEKKGKVLKILISQFTDLMIIILLIAGLLSVVLGDLKDGIVIMVIVILNSVIGFIQEYKAERILEKLKEKLEPKCLVIRNGVEKTINREELLPGDLVKISEGSIIPADGVLVESHDISVDESVLTGESLSLEKKQIEANEYDYKKLRKLKLDSANKVYMGTSVKRGLGYMIVTYTGLKSEFGKIAELTKDTKKQISPLQEEMFVVGKYVGSVTLVVSIALVFFGIFYQGEGIAESILFSASVAIAAVPEGLPTVITIALAFGVQKLARRKTLVRHLSSVESLGETTVICSDKTGTLTQNKMTVRHILTSGGDHLDITELKGYNSSTGYFLFKDKYGGEFKSKIFKKVSEKIGTLEKWGKLTHLITNYCNDSYIKKVKGKSTLFGDPTEGALKVISEKMGFSTKAKEIDRVSFSSERKMMSVLVKSGKEKMILSKGAPEILLEKCSHYLDKDGKVKKISKSVLDSYKKELSKWSDRGLRVLGFAYKETSLNKLKPQDEKQLVFSGMVAMSDPPRLDVKKAAELTRKAGIRTIIITGDNSHTAISIAKEIGIFSKDDDVEAYTSEDLAKISDIQLKKLLKKSNNKKILFARVMPQDKLRIVETLQKLDEIVAVTGDGVNDAPALQRAHVGVAMGDGSDISKEASHVVLMNNSFSTIVEAIRLGREVYANLKKFSWYIFSCNIGELFTVFTAIILAIPSPLTAITILLIDLGTDLLPALALSREDEGEEIMQIPPKPRDQKMINFPFVVDFLSTGLVIGVIIMAQYFFTLYDLGWEWGKEILEYKHIQAASVTFVSLVMIQLANSFNARNLRKSIFKTPYNNFWHLGAVFSSFVLVISFTSIPFFQKAFDLTSLTLIQWEGIFLAMILILLFGEVKKFIIKTI